MEENNAISPQETSAPVPDNYVRMEYTGTRQGSVTYTGLNRRTYRAGNNPSGKYHNVHVDDVDKLLSTGEFRVVSRPTTKPRMAAKEEAPIPTKTDAELQAERAAALLKAKEEVAAELALEPVAEAPTKDEPKAKKGRGKRA